MHEIVLKFVMYKQCLYINIYIYVYISLEAVQEGKIFFRVFTSIDHIFVPCLPKKYLKLLVFEIEKY